MAAIVALWPSWCPPPTPPHTKISQHTMRQVYVAKTTEYNCFYNICKLSKGTAHRRHAVPVFTGCDGCRMMKPHDSYVFNR
jgi:hypothetical protein